MEKKQESIGMKLTVLPVVLWRAEADDGVIGVENTNAAITQIWGQACQFRWIGGWRDDGLGDDELIRS